MQKGVKSTQPAKAKIMKENAEMKALLENGCRCAMCGKVKDKDTKFYLDTDPKLGGHSFARICRECARAIAHRRDEDGVDHEPTRESVIETLEYLNKPFIESLWNASIQESENMVTGKNRWTPWNAYIKNIQMVQYVGLTYKDSDHIKNARPTRVEKSSRTTSKSKMLRDHEGMDTYDSFEKNKEDVIRLLDYDPFEKELIADQPFLYAQLLMLMDSNQDQEMDMIRTSSAISIARGFLQASKLDDSIAKLMADVTGLEKNAATIKSLQDSKQKVMSMITSLAAESCLSLKNSKTATKGDNTWTGRIKKLKNLNLYETNGFDIATCKGMQQVQEISDASIMKQLALDDSDWSDMVAEMRQTITDLRRERDQYKELNRIILKENLALRDTLEEKGVDVKGETHSLKELYSVFAGNNEEATDESESDDAD
jgi:hypothetical protein